MTTLFLFNNDENDDDILLTMETAKTCWLNFFRNIDWTGSATSSASRWTQSRTEKMMEELKKYNAVLIPASRFFRYIEFEKDEDMIRFVLEWS